MAWEWIGTTVVGLAGIAGTYWGTRRQAEIAFTSSRESNENALKVARQQDEAHLAAMREERLQHRLEMAYQELLVWLVTSWEWAQSVYPNTLTGSVDEYTMPPPMPEDLHRVEAVVTAMWSPRVRQLMEQWAKEMAAVHGAGLMLTADLDALSRGVRPSYPQDDGAEPPAVQLH